MATRRPVSEVGRRFHCALNGATKFSDATAAYVQSGRPGSNRRRPAWEATEAVSAKALRRGDVAAILSVCADRHSSRIVPLSPSSTLKTRNGSGSACSPPTWRSPSRSATPAAEPQTSVPSQRSTGIKEVDEAPNPSRHMVRLATPLGRVARQATRPREQHGPAALALGSVGARRER